MNIDIYIELASLHQQLALQKKNEGDLEGALKENMRALRVLSSLVGNQLKPAVEQGRDLSAMGTSKAVSDNPDMMPDEENTMDDSPPAEQKP